MSLTSLGQAIIKKIATKKVRLHLTLDALISKFEVSCPNSQDLIKIIKQKNKLLLVLTQLKKNILKLDNTTKSLTPLLQTLNKASKLLKASPIPIAVGSPAVSLSVGSILTAGDSLQTLTTQVKGITFIISSFAAIKSYILQTIEGLLTKIKSLEALIEKCSQNKVNSIINKNIENNTQNINNGINSSNTTNILTDNDPNFINTELNSIDSSLINELQSTDNNETNTYKGFKFEILIDNNNTNKFIKRYAVAKTPSGVIVLKGESSFSSSVEVLIDELKFIIDRDNLKI